MKKDAVPCAKQHQITHKHTQKKKLDIDFSFLSNKNNRKNFLHTLMNICMIIVISFFHIHFKNNNEIIK